MAAKVLTMKEISPDLRKSATAAIRDCLNVSRDERVLVVTDTIRNDIGIPLYRAALDLGCDALMVEMRPRRRSGEEPPRAVEHALRHTDVFAMATTTSLSHTEARKEACKEGARGASIPIQNTDQSLVLRTFARGGMTADYKAMSKNIDRIMDKLKHVREARVRTAKGTDIMFYFDHRQWHADKGLAVRPGEFTNLPGGEVYIAPFTAEGNVVIDGTFGDFGMLKEPLRLTIKDGYVVTAKGGHADELQKVFDQLGHNARNVAELGIGMNPKATLCGILLEDEKVGNTIHVALGDNTGFGGNVSVQFHFDGIVTEPRISLDDEEIDLKEYVFGAMKTMA